MYRIRRETGEEVTLGSIDEFGAAVASGIVTAKAEIFHARAEKWLPIASHPHFKMAHDRATAAATQKAAARNPAVTASGQRPGLGASGQRPAVTAQQAPAPTSPRVTAPQLRVVRADAPAAPAAAASDGAVTQKPAPRWNTGQRPAARAVAPKPQAPAAPPASDLRIVRADTLLSGAATAPALPETEFELLPEIEAPEAVEPVAAPPASAAPVAEPVAEPVRPVAERVVQAVAETVVERAPASVELVSHEEQPAARRGEVDIINPDRAMPVVSDRDLSALEIPAPIRDFAPVEPALEHAAKPASKKPLLVGIGLAAAAAAVIGYFVMRPSKPAAPAGAPAQATQAAAAPVASPVAPAPEPVGPTAAATRPTGASTGLGGDIPARKPKKQADDAKATLDDGLDPPPAVVIPAAPSLGKIGDAAALPTVDAGTIRNDAMDREKALERTRRQIDSSMRR